MIVGFRLLFYNVSYYSFGAEINFSVLKGKVNADGVNVDGIYVINLTTEKSVMMCRRLFWDKGRAGDTLLLSAVQYQSRRVVLTSEDFENRLFCKNGVNYESVG
jgi:hypothetical protein